MDFFNREDELAALGDAWDSARAELLIVYGRRRVGKSRLIGHFAEGRRTLLFEATSGSERDHLDDISKEIARVSGRRIYEEQPLTSWRAAMAAFEELIASERTLIALDEFQFVARRNAEIGSLINALMRDHEGNPNLRLLLAGSDVPFFEQDVVGYAATSYGRRTGSLHLKPFRFHGVRPFTPDWTVEDRIRAWAVFGGIPYYLNEIRPKESLPQNILRAILIPGGLLREEPTFLLSQETRIRERHAYMSILRAIANGCTRRSEIATRISRKSDELRPYLDVLEEMRLVTRRYPVTRAHSKKVFYAITDPFLRFWFRFVAPYESRLTTRESARDHLEQTILPQLDHFTSQEAFEEICRDWALHELPDAAEVGRWWGSRRERVGGTLHNRQYEADVVPIDAHGKVIALGSCKWSIREHDTAELAKLEIVRSMLADADQLASREIPLLFFDKTGFSDRLRQLEAERSDVRLISADGLEPSA